MDIAVDRGATGTTHILRLKGPLTISTLFGLQAALRDTGNADTVIDVTDVPYMDSAGLGTLLSHWAHTQHVSAKFAVTGVSPRIAVLLEVTKVNTVLPMFATAEEADLSFTGGKPRQKLSGYPFQPRAQARIHRLAGDSTSSNTAIDTTITKSQIYQRRNRIGRRPHAVESIPRVPPKQRNVNTYME